MKTNDKSLVLVDVRRRSFAHVNGFIDQLPGKIISQINKRRRVTLGFSVNGQPSSSQNRKAFENVALETLLQQE